MKIVCISDTHTLHDQVTVPEGDVLVHAGDMGLEGKLQGEIFPALDWIDAQPHRHKVVIAGNHDWALQHLMDENAEDLLRVKYPYIHYLRDSGVTIDGVRFYGSPWQPWFMSWAFNLTVGTLHKKWDVIPPVDVLVTHGPPNGIRDWVGSKRVGCRELSSALRRIRPKLHVFGHIHGGYGITQQNGTTYVNASVVNEAYRVKNMPIVCELFS